MKSLKAVLLPAAGIVSTLLVVLFLFAAPAALAESDQFRLPAYKTIVLDNGLTINLMRQDEVPIISVNVVVHAGAVNDAIAGLANMTANGLMLGAGDRSKLDIEQTVDFLGASINSAAGKEGSYLIAEFMSKDSGMLLPLVHSIITNPNFNQAEFDKLQQREIADLARAKESPRNVIAGYFERLVFNQHPYGNAVSGNRDSLAAIKQSDLKTFHQRYYQPANTAISVVGDFDIAQMQSGLEKLFGDWQNTHEVQQPDLANGLPVLNKSQVLLVNKDDALETTFMIGSAGISRNNSDFVALGVINTILGGRFTSWLNDELRVNAGLTYGARSGFTSWSKGGTFGISSFTKTASSKETIDLALKTYTRLWENGINQATLDSAKAYVKGQFPPDYETSRQLAGLLSDMYMYGFDEDFINGFEAQVDNLTIEKTRQLIADNFPQSNLQFVIIGKASEISESAASYGTLKQVDIKSAGFSD